MGYKVILTSQSHYPNANLSLDFVIRWAIVRSQEENDTYVIVKDECLHLTVSGTKNPGVISRFNEERILKAICANPKVGNIWLDYGDKIFEDSLVFTICSAADAGPWPRVQSYISPSWQKELATAEKRVELYMELDRYQETCSTLVAGGDRRRAWAKQEHRVEIIERLSNLLASESGNPTKLPENWKQLPLPQLESLLEKIDGHYRSLLVEKIDYFGGSANPAEGISDLQVELDRVRQ
ncbi:hypothetical protein BDV06DRAFT_231490 [Aspergillus oleicola]